MKDLRERIAVLEMEIDTLRKKLLEDEQLASNENIPHRDAAAASPHSPMEYPEQVLENSPSKILQYLKSILGYTVRISGNVFTLRSVYAFCEDDIFEVEICNNKLVLRNTDYLSEWTDLFNTYVVAGRSYCAFFAAVTLELFNRKTFG